jgi:hypothetical protein
MRRWYNENKLESKNFTCGHCGKDIASELGYQTSDSPVWRIYICHHCSKPVFIDNANKQVPGAIFGKVVSGVTDASVTTLYDEARKAISVNAFTSAVLACRKLMMHIAVDQGAEEGLNFVGYVQYLADNHLIPPGAKGWVDHIREKGNEANHEIIIMTREEAERLITFCAMLMQMIYEFPSMVPVKTKA